METRVGDGTAPDCFASRLLSTEGHIYDKPNKMGLIQTLLTAGSESTASVMQWFFKACILYPEFVKEAQQELEQVVGDRLPGWEDRPNLPYIEAVVNEIHRWSPMSPMAFYHTTVADDTYRNFQIPKGTTVIGNMYAVNQNDECYGDPTAFRPNRWLHPSDPRHMVNGRLPDLHHFNFGYGRRECPGKHVANASLYILIARVMWAFNITGDMAETSMEGGESRLHPNPWRTES
jgi:cytochrome P450